MTHSLYVIAVTSLMDLYLFKNNNCLCTGVGKTHFIQKEISKLPHSVVIVMNETFNEKNTIKKLNELPYEKDCGIFFNFTIHDPGVSFISYTSYLG